MQNNLNFFLLVLSLTRINSESDDVTKREKIESKFELKNKIGRTRDESGLTEAITVDEESPNEIEVRKLSVAEIKHQEKNNNKSLELQQRASRDALKTTRNQEMECVLCYNGISTSDECYSGDLSKTVKCSDMETCFTELHPLYIKRGCMVPTAINRTFACKCPLCNDKPSADPTYYEYRTISDWRYDNERLQQPVVGMDLFCKVCETMGRNSVSDKICEIGTSTDYVLCGNKELCYTNMDILGSRVSRGCLKSPAYNSMHIFCNESYCNNKSYENPTKYRNNLVFRVLPDAQTSGFSGVPITAKQNFLSVLVIFRLFIIFFIIESGNCQI